MSATYKCDKCELTGWSKNIHTRSLFTSNSMASQLRNIINVSITTTEVNGNERRIVTFEFPYMDTAELPDRPNPTDSDLEEACVELIKEVSAETAKQWLCDHKWHQTGGEELGGM